MNSRAFGGTFIFSHTNFDLGKFSNFTEFKPSLIWIQIVPEDMQQRNDDDTVDVSNNQVKEMLDIKKNNNAKKERVLYTIQHDFKNLSDNEILHLKLRSGNNEGKFEMNLLRKALTRIETSNRGRFVFINIIRKDGERMVTSAYDGSATHACTHCSSDAIIETICNKCLTTVCIEHMRLHQKTVFCKLQTKVYEKVKELMPKLLEPTPLCRRDKCTSTVNSKFKKCGNCKQARYCSRECQVADWSDHKTTCYKIGEEVD